MVEEYYKKPDLKKGEAFKIKGYPENPATYLGFSESTGAHVFHSSQPEVFFLVLDNWIMEEDGKITNKPTCLLGIERITQQKLERDMQAKRRLTRILSETGSEVKV
ncbi:MAG: hypothetical protein AABW58_01740 [Nanoarchaeota archaeon]